MTDAGAPVQSVSQTFSAFCHVQGRVLEAQACYADAMAVQNTTNHEALPSSTANSDAADDDDWETGMPSPLGLFLDCESQERCIFLNILNWCLQRCFCRAGRQAGAADCAAGRPARI